MTTLIGRRLLYLIPTLLLVSLAVFALSLQINPERAAQIRAGGIEADSQEIIDRYIDELGLRDPFFVRYGRWVSDAVQLDLGRSLTITRSAADEEGNLTKVGIQVTDRIKEVLPRTLSLAASGMFFGMLIGIPVGIISGLRPGSLIDRATVFGATLGIALPSFWVAMLLIYYFAISKGWLPAVGYNPPSAGLWGWARNLILPGLALGTFLAAVLARQLRAALIDVMGSAYVRTAWAKGSSPRRVVVVHALKNAAVAPVTILGLQLGTLLGGTVVLEIIFGIEGMGRVAIGAVRASDVTMLQGVVLFYVLINITINLLVDITYGLLNPKVRLS